MLATAWLLVKDRCQVQTVLHKFASIKCSRFNTASVLFYVLAAFYAK